MMSGATIRQLSRDAAVLAARANKVPFTVEKEDLEDWQQQAKAGRLPRLPFPNLGDFEPAGWKRTDREPIFVDHSGWGAEGESALTPRTLICGGHLTAGRAYAIIEVGQFQLYLGEFEREEKAEGNEADFEGELTSEEEDELAAENL